MYFNVLDNILPLPLGAVRPRRARPRLGARPAVQQRRGAAPPGGGHVGVRAAGVGGVPRPPRRPAHPRAPAPPPSGGRGPAAVPAGGAGGAAVPRGGSGAQGPQTQEVRLRRPRTVSTLEGVSGRTVF